MRSSLFKASVVLAALLIAVPVMATPVSMSKRLPVPEGNSALIQLQHHHGGGGGGHRSGGGWHRGGGGGGGWSDDGGAVAAGIIGGLIIGAIIANETQRQRSVSYCARHYRSYDPSTMTFIGRDGRRYRCP